MTDHKEFEVVGRNEQKVDGYTLITGKPVFAGDVDLTRTRSMWHC